jgi:hypothetical protein
MKTLTTAYSSVVTATKTLPGYLVEIIMPTTYLRFSSIGDVTWKGNYFIGSSIKVSGISSNPGGNSTGNLSLSPDPSDPNILVGYALNSNEGFMGREIRIWSFDSTLVGSTTTGVLETADAIPIFSGIGDNVSIDKLEITISLSSSSITYLYAPRVKICKASGFNFIQPKGLRIPWGNEVFVLE